MPYEYEVHYQEFKIGIFEPPGDTEMLRADLLAWINELGARDWRFVHLFPAWNGLACGLFERKIEINKNLRALQLGKEIEKETLDDRSSNETDSN